MSHTEIELASETEVQWWLDRWKNAFRGAHAVYLDISAEPVTWITQDYIRFRQCEYELEQHGSSDPYEFEQHGPREDPPSIVKWRPREQKYFIAVDTVVSAITIATDTYEHGEKLAELHRWVREPYCARIHGWGICGEVLSEWHAMANAKPARDESQKP